MIETAFSPELHFKPGRRRIPPSRDKLIQVALEYQALGWTVIPVRGKIAAVQWEKLKGPLPEAELRRAIAQGGVTGIAVVLGPASGGLCCRDFDVPGAHERWAASVPEIAATLPTVRTARGAHVYFLMASPMPRSETLKDGEFKAEGTYCVLPPSLHKDGAIYYEWTIRPESALSISTINARETGLLHNWGATESTESTDSTESTESLEMVRERKLPKCLGELVSRHVPRHGHANHPHLFNLAVDVYTLQVNGGITDDSSVQSMRLDAFGMWWEQSKGFARAGSSREDYLEEYMEAFAGVKYPREERMFKEALEKAKRATPPALVLENFSNSKFLLFCCICQELARVHLPEPFFLSYRKAADVLGLPDHEAAGRMFKRLLGLRVIKVEKTHSPSIAPRYRYLLPIPDSQTGAEEMIV